MKRIFYSLSICLLSICASMIPACSVSAEKVHLQIDPVDKKHTESNAYDGSFNDRSCCHEIVQNQQTK